MALIINIIAAIVLFLIPVQEYRKGKDKIVPAPFEKGKHISISFNLYFLVYSILTAMIFLGPLSLLKYAYWVVFLLLLILNGQIEVRFGGIVWSYILFLIWSVISAILFSSAKFQALMMIVKYTLPLFYLWLGYSAINDSDDLLYFMKKIVIAMCIYALLIGGFSAKFIGPLYVFLNFGTNGLVISYASLADYFSGLIVVPIALYIITNDKKWLYAIIWVILSTILETVRTGLGGLFLASSLFLITIFRAKAIPWVTGLCISSVAVIFTVPSFREKMFFEEKNFSEVSVADMNFDSVRSNARGAIWEINLRKFYHPHKIIGSGLGTSVEWMKNRSGLKLIHSDYVQILCDLGLVGIISFGFFIVVTLFSIISTAWASESPFVLKIIGGMALGSCGGTFFSMAFDNVVAYAQQSFVIPFIFIGIYLKIKDLYHQGAWE